MIETAGFFMCCVMVLSPSQQVGNTKERAMADISKSGSHTIEKNEMRKRLEDLAESMSSKYGLTHSWNEDVCTLEGGALKAGTVVMTEDSVAIDLTLGFMAKMFKAQIEGEVEQWIEKVTTA